MVGLRLLIDYRERNLAALLEGVCEEIDFAQLPVVDYLLISGSEAIVVERKTVNDFLSSVRSNRLWDQLLRMMSAEEVLGYPIKRRMLLIQGKRARGSYGETNCQNRRARTDRRKEVI